MRVGFIGLGKMGRPMAGNVLKAGFAMAVHNRSRAAVDALVAAGARAAASPAAVATASDVVLTCLPTPDSVEEVYLGAAGLIPHARAGHLLVDHSTVGPDLSRRLAAAAGERGAAFLDAPVSGGVAGAEAGTLTIMVGGDAAAFERALPVLQTMGQRVRHVGPSGHGSIVKLVNQLLVGIHSAAAAEAMLLAAKAGADPRVVHDVVSTSFGASTIFNRNAPLYVQRDFDRGTNISLLAKDMGLILDLARQLGLRSLLACIADQVLAEARAEGLAERDIAALVLPLERLAGVEIAAPPAD
ncbi:MAG: NAD(P)-dependent oxidoreductase [Chloroflexi bacterium]|nr:NAD(P)-dependent oxidoreductase [Chloroflexota bacterium]MBI4505899.1 NAD(P)-dependent oxidoreductase [Chloroflexota bacterium]